MSGCGKSSPGSVEQEANYGEDSESGGWRIHLHTAWIMEKKALRSHEVSAVVHDAGMAEHITLMLPKGRAGYPLAFSEEKKDCMSSKSE